MPFKSRAQQGFMFAKHPEMAKRFAAETPETSTLPEHVRKRAKQNALQKLMSGGGPY